MTIQIDDSGWGSLIGGVAIGVYRTSTGEFAHEVVAPRFFQGAAFEGKEYLAEAARLAGMCFERLRVQPTERVEICTGYVLNGVRDWLTEAGFAWQPARIQGALQDMVERAFGEHLALLGFHADYRLLTNPQRKGLLWWRQIAWLKGGNADARAPIPERAAVCKTGWASFDIWATHPYHKAKQLAQARRSERRP
jgi:hypothetical protein